MSLVTLAAIIAAILSGIVAEQQLAARQQASWLAIAVFILALALALTGLGVVHGNIL